MSIKINVSNRELDPASLAVISVVRASGITEEIKLGGCTNKTIDLEPGDRVEVAPAAN